MAPESKKNYKLGITQRNTIIQLLKENKTNKEVIEAVNQRYNIEITSGYISQIRKKLFFFELSSYNKDVERKIRSKLKMDVHMLNILEKGYNMLDEYMGTLDFRKLTVKDVSLISGILSQTHRIYMDLNKNTENKNMIDYNIKRALDL
ncbi:MAG: hypothetical protein ABIJ92_03045 [Candidatus Aenigmatarchaeota archaeon]